MAAQAGDNPYQGEVEEDVLQQLQDPNAPLFIPRENLGWSFAYDWNLSRTDDQGEAFRAFEPLLSTVTCKIQNYRTQMVVGKHLLTQTQEVL